MNTLPTQLAAWGRTACSLPFRLHRVNDVGRMGRKTLPGVLAQIELIAGFAAADAIARERGGTRFYIPKHPHEEHWLVKLCGTEAAAKITQHYGGSTLVFPVGPYGALARVRKQLDEMILAGASATECSRDLGYSRRGVEFRRQQLRDMGESIPRPLKTTKPKDRK